MKNKGLTSVKQIVIHLLFVLLVWLFFYFFFSVGSKNRDFVFWFSILLSLTTLMASYVFIYQLIPEFLINKRYKLFALYTIYALVFIVCAVLMIVVFGFVFFYNLEYQNMPALTKNSGVILVCVLFIVALASAFKILKSNYKSLEEKSAIEQKFLQTQLQLKEQELKFLKMQIHPHFLFNTLNTLYGFALKQSEKTPELILKLSNLLDYILYQVDKPKVFLKDEINHIQNYISLEKMRFQSGLEVDFLVNDYNDDTQIPPMLLLPFVENAFKHGFKKNGVLKVDMELKLENNFLNFSVTNSHKQNDNSKSGIGLKNIKKRLEMLFGDNSILSIQERTNEFSVILKIPL